MGGFLPGTGAVLICALALSCSDDGESKPAAAGAAMPASDGGSAIDSDIEDADAAPPSPDAGGDAGPTADAGSKIDAGDAASDAAADDDGSSPDRDPQPVDIDLTGLVDTSGRHLVFRGMALGELTLVDLESGQVHALDPSGAAAAYTMRSPRGDSLLFAGANAASDENLHLIRFTADGFVPARLVDGFAGMPGNHYRSGFTLTGYVGWSADARFVGLERGSNLIGDGVDIVDTFRYRRHFSAGEPLDDSALVVFARQGLWFHYWLRADGQPARHAYARLTEQGASAPVHMPEHASLQLFDPAGQRLFYITSDPVLDRRRAFVRDLEDGTDVELQSAVTGPQRFSSLLGIEADGRHVRALYSDGAGTVTMRRLAADGSVGSALSDLSRPLRTQVAPRDGNVVLYEYLDAMRELEATDASGQTRAELGQSDPALSFELGPLGNRHVYYTLANSELHAIGIDDGGAIRDSLVSMPGEGGVSVCRSYDGPEPGEGRMAFTESEGGSLVLLDTRGGAVTRAAKLLPQNGGRLACPVWSPDGDALAYQEHGATPTTVSLVRWPADGPQAPQPIFERSEAIHSLELIAP